MRFFVGTMLSLILMNSPCLASGEESKDRHAAASSTLTQVDKLAHQVTRTLSEFATDVLPVMKAVGEETAREARADLPKIGAELKNQLKHLLPVKKGRD